MSFAISPVSFHSTNTIMPSSGMQNNAESLNSAAALVSEKSKLSLEDKASVSAKEDDASKQNSVNALNASSETDQQNEEIQQVVNQLKARDREVRTHEQAHLAAAGQYATSGPSYTYQVGPDGKRYAVGGEVGIDTSPIAGDPQATLMKAQQIISASLAPAEPSAQDQRVAAAAAQMAATARAEIREQNQSKSGDENPEGIEISETVDLGDRSNQSQNTGIEANNVENILGFERNQFELRLAGIA